MVGGELGEDLAVEGEAGFLELRDEGGVGLVAILADGGVEADYPELAEVSLLVAAVSKRVAACTHERLVSGVELLGADATIALSSLENILSALIRHYFSLDSCHTKMITTINYFAPVAGKKRRRTFIDKLIATEPRLPRRSPPLCLALKWF